MTVKETYHADCLRIKQLEQQLARYEEYHKRLNKVRLNQKSCGGRLQHYDYIVKEFESEQNER